MSNYTKTTNFATKDSLPSGDPNKIVKGAEINTEFDNIATAVSTKANSASPTFTGTVTIPTADINGGAIDGTVIGGTTAASVTGTTLTANTSLNIAGDGATVTGIKDEDDMVSNSATKLATQQSIKAYVDSQVTAQDLDVTTDLGTISIDLDSETLTVAGGTGLDSSAIGNTVTLGIDSTVATLTGTQTLTNKTLTAPVISGNLTTDGTVDGRDIATDGTKLDGIEALADVTDTANVTAAGALMDSEVTNLAQVKAFDSADYATAAQGSTADSALQNVVEDTTPQLGGNLDLNSNNITGTGNIDVTGTVTADGLTVDKASGGGEIARFNGGSYTALDFAGGLSITSDTTTNYNRYWNFNAGDALDIYRKETSSGTTDTRAITCSGGGDISFYEDTGTTPKLFWDASAESLGIGTSSPSSLLHISGANGAGRLELQNTWGTTVTNWRIAPTISGVSNNGFEIRDVTQGASRLVIDSSGNVGIGTSSPAKQLEVQNAAAGTAIRASNNGGGYAELACTSNATSTAELNFTNSLAMLGGNVGIGTSSPSAKLTLNDAGQQVGIDFKEAGTTRAHIEYDGTIPALELGTNGAANVVLKTSNTERLRIDSSGNVGIGTSSPQSDGNTTNLEVSSAFGARVLIANTDTNGRKYGFYSSNSGIFGLADYTASGTPTRMAIDSSGRVGIGTTSPSKTLTVAGTGLRVQSTASADFYSTAQDALIVNNGTDNLRFWNNGSERMRIDSSGNLLVGTTDQYALNGGFTVQTGAVDYISIGHTSSVSHGNYYAAFRHGTNTIGTISQNGTTGVLYNTSSDERLKENIADSADAGSKIDAIQIRQFDWKSDGSHQDYGVIAQELVEVAPEAVHQPVDSEDMMGVDYSKLVPMLIKEIQTLRNRVAQLETN